MADTGKKALALLVSVVLVAGVTAFGGTFGTGDWYAALNKPAFNPPNWVFGPVWSVLYLTMAVAAWLVWEKRREAAVGLPLAVYTVHLVSNGLWSFLFFGLHRPGLAFAEIVILDLLILATIFLFWRVRRTAGLILVPYAAWVTFAAVLNFTLWRMNLG